MPHAQSVPPQRRGYPPDSRLFSQGRAKGSGRRSETPKGYTAKGGGGDVEGRGSGSQPTRDAEGAYYLEGVKLPWWWPFDPVTRQPIHKLFRAMSKDYNELWPVKDRPPDYPDRDLSQNEEKFQAMDVFDAVDTGSEKKSPFIHCSRTEGGARWFLNAGKDRRRTDHSLFCKVNLVTLYKNGCLHQNSIIDISTETAWNHFFKLGPYGYHERVREEWNYAMFNALKHDEFLICWRGEIPLEAYEVTQLTPPLKNDPPIKK